MSDIEMNTECYFYQLFSEEIKQIISSKETAEYLRERYQIIIPQPANLKHLESHSDVEYTSESMH